MCIYTWYIYIYNYIPGIYIQYICIYIYIYNFIHGIKVFEQTIIWHRSVTVQPSIVYTVKLHNSLQQITQIPPEKLYTNINTVYIIIKVG